MKKLVLSIVAVLLAIIGNAQLNPVGNLTIFSEDGQKFYLELNGERYNTEPQTNVRIEELPNPYYSCKVVFADSSIPTLSKNTLDIADMDGIMQDVTYRIKNSNGKRSLKYYSSVPVEGNMPRPRNVAVYRYGTPNDMIVRADGVVVTETTTVQHTTGMGETMGVGMNVGGVNMGVSISVPGETVMTTSTTTTTTSSGTRYNDNVRPNDNAPRGCRYAMSARDYDDAKATIKSISFDDTRASTAMQIISANCLNTSQIIGLLDLFSFEDTKLNLAKTAYGYCVDQNNYYKVVTAFKFDSSKEELNRYMQQNRR